jgi:hypothetical protein
MALELVFECPRTLGKLRAGPLGNLLDGFCSWLLSRGFRRTTIRKHLFNVSHLNEHLASRKSGFIESLCSKDISGFFKAYYFLCRRRGGLEGYIRRVRHSINRFLDYLREVEIFDPSSGQEIYEPLLDAYLNWMRHYQHASEGTLGVRRHSTQRFLEWLGPDATPEGLSKLRSDRIEDFFVSHAQTMGRSARRSMQSALRTFLRFCLPCSNSLSAIVGRYIRAAGIEIPNKGAHAFRHCFATRMLHKGHSLKEIADVLGHRHLGTTFVYTKVAFNALKQVALEWPREVEKCARCVSKPSGCPDTKLHYSSPPFKHRLSVSSATIGILRPLSGRRTPG